MSKDNIYALGIKNILFSFHSQVIALSVGVVLSFILPLTIGVEQFGYWQVYVLYVTFAMFFGLGFTDGIYLTYGHYSYADLPYDKIRNTILIYAISAVIFTVLTLLLTNLEKDTNKQFALIAATLNIFLLLLSNVAVSILQFTNRIKEYSFIVAFGRILLLLGVVIIVALKINSFKLIIIVDILTKIIILSINIYLVKEVFFGKIANLSEALKDWLLNIKVGIKIMLAVYASTLVMNIGRILIERFDGIKAYSSYALAVSISSFFLVFVSTFSLSFYPFLKRVNPLKWSEIYERFNTLIFFASFVMLGIFFPLSYVIKNWYIDYIAVIQYLPLFLVMTLMQSKEQFLHITYMKTLRKEKELLFINVIFSLIALVVLVPLYLVTKKIYWVAFATSFIVLAKSYTLEFYLRKRNLQLKFNNILLELLFIFMFLFFISVSTTYISLSIFILLVLLMFFIKRIELIELTKRLYQELRTK